MFYFLVFRHPYIIYPLFYLPVFTGPYDPIFINEHFGFRETSSPPYALARASWTGYPPDLHRQSATACAGRAYSPSGDFLAMDTPSQARTPQSDRGRIRSTLRPKDWRRFMSSGCWEVFAMLGARWHPGRGRSEYSSSGVR